jgi:hypothetical protein
MNVNGDVQNGLPSPASGSSPDDSGQPNIDVTAIRAAVARQARRVSAGIDDMAAYLSRQVADESHREVTGPLLFGPSTSVQMSNTADSHTVAGRLRTPMRSGYRSPSVASARRSIFPVRPRGSVSRIRYSAGMLYEGSA